MSTTYDKQFFERAGGLADLEDIKDLPIILQFLDPKRGEKILDVGCGKGRFSDIIAQYGADVTGIDISEYGIEQAGIKWEGRKELQFLRMNALEMDYKTNLIKSFAIIS